MPLVLGYEMGEPLSESGSPQDCPFRWWLYNAAFRLFGRKPCWDKLGQFLW